MDLLRLGGGAGHCLRAPPTEESIVPTESRLDVLSLEVILGPLMSLGRRTSTVSPGDAYVSECHGISGWREDVSLGRASPNCFSCIKIGEL